MEAGVVEDIHRNQIQSRRTEAVVTEGEVTMSRDKDNTNLQEGSMKKTSHVVMTSINIPKGSDILREEEANKIKDEERLVDATHLRFSWVTWPAVM